MGAMQSAPAKPFRRRVSIPLHTGPHVRLVFAEIARQAYTYDEIEERSGVLRATMKAWRHRNTPGLANPEAVLGVLGWDLVPIPRDRVVDHDIIAELTPVADRLGSSLGDALQFATEIAVGLRSKPERSVDRKAI